MATHVNCKQTLNIAIQPLLNAQNLSQAELLTTSGTFSPAYQFPNHAPHKEASGPMRNQDQKNGR